MNELIQFAFAIWTLYYVYNYSLIFAGIKGFVDKWNTDDGVRYMLSCSFCFSFWAALFCAIWTNNFMIPLVVPAMAHFLNLIYLKLVPDKIEDIKSIQTDTIRIPEFDGEIVTDNKVIAGIRGPNPWDSESPEIKSNISPLDGVRIGLVGLNNKTHQTITKQDYYGGLPATEKI